MAQVHRLRAEVVTEIRRIFGLVSESRTKTEEAGKLADDFEVQRTQVNGSTALSRVKRPLVSCRDHGPFCHAPSIGPRGVGKATRGRALIGTVGGIVGSWGGGPR